MRIRHPVSLSLVHLSGSRNTVPTNPSEIMIFSCQNVNWYNLTVQYDRSSANRATLPSKLTPPIAHRHMICSRYRLTSVKNKHLSKGDKSQTSPSKFSSCRQIFLQLAYRMQYFCFHSKT